MGNGVELRSSNLKERTFFTLASFSNVLARRGVQSRMASPATAISHGGHPWWLAVNESSRGLRRSGAGITPESSPACRGFCFSRTLAGLWPPLVVAVLCRRRSPASAGFPSAQPIYQRNFCQLFLKRDHVLYIY